MCVFHLSALASESSKFSWPKLCACDSHKITHTNQKPIIYHQTASVGVVFEVFLSLFVLPNLQNSDLIAQMITAGSKAKFLVDLDSLIWRVTTVWLPGQIIAVSFQQRKCMESIILCFFKCEFFYFCSLQRYCSNTKNLLFAVIWYMF